MNKSNTCKYASWCAVAGGFLMMMTIMGIVNNCYSIFIIPITKDLGFSRGQYTICQSIVSFFTVLSSMCSWRIYKKAGVIQALWVSFAFLVPVYFAQAFAVHLWVFYILSALCGFFVGISTTIPISIILKRWFQDKRYNTAIGLAFMGSGFGGMIFNPIANHFIQSQGWRNAYMILSALMATCLILAALLFHSPGGEEPLTEAKTNVSEKSTPFFNTFSHILLSVVLITFTLSMTSLIYMVTPYLQDIGYSPSFAANVSSACMAILAIGKVVSGIILDHRGVRVYALLAYIAGAMGLIGLICFRSPLYLIAVLIGIFLACPFGTIAVPSLARYIDSDHIEERISTLASICYVGPALSPLISGIIYDHYSSYVPLFIAGTVVTLLDLGLLEIFFRAGEDSILNRTL